MFIVRDIRYFERHDRRRKCTEEAINPARGGHCSMSFEVECYYCPEDGISITTDEDGGLGGSPQL
jgi:hypothetical protein